MGIGSVSRPPPAPHWRAYVVGGVGEHGAGSSGDRWESVMRVDRGCGCILAVCDRRWICAHQGEVEEVGYHRVARFGCGHLECPGSSFKGSSRQSGNGEYFDVHGPQIRQD
jgi:hypothetical protein